MPTTAAQRDTYYLPAARAGEEELRAAEELVAASALPLLFDEHPDFTLVLNGQRQIVYSNKAAQRLLDLGGGDLVGRRPGEAFACVHCPEGPSGCGTGAFCRLCGAATSIAHSIGGEAYSDECLIRRRRQGDREESIDLLVWTGPFQLCGRNFVLFTAQNISLLKRHEVLERVFYHDIANTVTGIQSLLELMKVDEEEDAEYAKLLHAAANQLAEEIASHRALKAAEERTLAVDATEVDGFHILEETVAFFTYYLHGRDLAIAIDPGSSRPRLWTDPAILRRILVNMTKNALEAAEPGETIRLGCALEDGRAVFAVRNRATIPEEAQWRIFERSFSTKGPGRGVGTYGMRLLGEHLGGRVDFSSKEGAGTTFALSLPLEVHREVPPELR